MTRTKAFIVAVGFVAASFATAVPAGADPTDDPCHLGDIAVTLICKLMPIAPGLDHDIDLTQGAGNLNGQPLPEMPEGAPISEKRDAYPGMPQRMLTAPGLEAQVRPRSIQSVAVLAWQSEI